MIRRLMRAYDRAATGLDHLQEVAWTLTEIIILWARPRSKIPTFPLRCQHCERPIRFATANHPASRGGGMPRAIYHDPAGLAFCYRGIPHRPMPSIR